MSGAGRPVALTNASMEGERVCVRIDGGHVAGVNTAPARGDLVVDLHGERLLPGLINAHDHLQFNNFAHTKYRDKHRNAGEWIADVSAHRARDARLAAASTADSAARLYMGGLKNLLSGVTTVCHHDEFLPQLARDEFPVRVLADYGWAHSPGLNTDAELRASHARAPRDRPWIVHAGEGVDAGAAGEFERLEALGCIGANTVLVHGLAFDRGQLERLCAAGGALIWCPASNLFLFGRTLDPAPLLAQGRLAFGSDSRISGSRDLLEELGVALAAFPACAPALEALVTRDNARLLRLGDCGMLVPGARADLVVLPAGMPLAHATRADLRAVVVGGQLRYGDADLAEALCADGECVSIRLDGRHKVLAREIAAGMQALAVHEPGLEMTVVAGRAA